MTIQVTSAVFGKSKASLQTALNTTPTAVVFYDPSIFEGSRGYFTGSDIGKGEQFAVVMDHPKRLRFSTIKRLEDGSFKVS